MYSLDKSQAALVGTNAELREAWIAQLEKDMDLDLQALRSSNHGWEEGLDIVQSELENAYSETDSRWSAMLYRVDVSPLHLQSEMQSGRWSSWHELAARAIAYREFQKVYFRFQYAGRL